MPPRCAAFAVAIALLFAAAPLPALAGDTSSSGGYDLAEALKLSFQFYDAQRSTNSPVSWRHDSFLDDCGGSMAGGYFDAGDHLKLLFPMSTSLAFIGLATSQFSDGMAKAGALDGAESALRYGADFVLAAHASPDKLIGQVGNPGSDHSFWGRPSEYPGPRPCYTWNLSSQPASDLAGAAASALAATALVFENSDPDYAERALSHAKNLYKAATANEGKYSSSYSDATYVYASATFRDDLALAAAMLWKATGDDYYLSETKAQRAKSDFQVESYVNWDAVGPVSAILLQCGGEATDESKAQVTKFLSDWSDCSSNGFQKTPKGLCIAPLGGWGNLRHATSAAFAATLLASCTDDSSVKDKALAFARSQIEYALGSSGRSFVVGIGNDPPLKPHHRGASCPDKPASCGQEAFENPGPNPQILYGALVGGPRGPGDNYSDDRKDFQQNEVAVDFNAGYTGALAGLLALQ